MTVTKRVLTFPLLVLISLLERITKPMWNFFGTCVVFFISFKVANAGVDPENFVNCLRAVFWDAVLMLVAFQTLPELFFKMFDED
jgi:cation transporter-like permease